jgi:SAM-dependent methyltransferase
MSGAAPRRPTGGDYFAAMWRDDDPWDHAGRAYEQRKYDLTMAHLPRGRYRAAFEPGCATGLLTARLARRCDAVVAMDRHPRAVAITAARCRELGNVVARLGCLPGDVPDPPATGTPGGDGPAPAPGFDLVVCSEVLYYLDAAGVRSALERTTGRCAPGAHLVAVHYRPHVPEHALSGDDAHALVDGSPAWRRLGGLEEPDFLLGVWGRR